MPKIVDVEARRAELGAAAARSIARAGVGAATLKEVAAEAGWTTGALTHYFADKRELLLYTFRASLAQRRANRDHLATTPLEALIEALERALPLNEESRVHWMVMIACSAQAAGDDEIAAAQRDAYREFRSRVIQLVGEWGLADKKRSVAVAEQLIALADGIAMQALFDPASWPPKRQAATLRAAVHSILAG